MSGWLHRGVYVMRIPFRKFINIINSFSKFTDFSPLFCCCCLLLIFLLYALCVCMYICTYILLFCCSFLRFLKFVCLVEISCLWYFLFSLFCLIKRACFRCKTQNELNFQSNVIQQMFILYPKAQRTRKLFSMADMWVTSRKLLFENHP